MSVVYEFKAGIQAGWSVSGEGLLYKNGSVSWDRIRNVIVYTDPKSPLQTGSFMVSIDGKAETLPFLAKDRDRAFEAFDFMKSKIREAKDAAGGASKESRKSFLKIYQPEKLAEVMLVARDVVPDTEHLFVALKGSFKEYLFCTDKMVYIYKKGFMTGKTFGDGTFKLPYSNISSAEVSYGAFSAGYFVLLGAGLERKPLDYWNNKTNSPQKEPNAISLATKELRDSFEEAASFIIAEIDRQEVSSAGSSAVAAQKSAADELRELKGLLDDGIISADEFNVAKKRLLGL